MVVAVNGALLVWPSRHRYAVVTVNWAVLACLVDPILVHSSGCQWGTACLVDAVWERGIGCQLGTAYLVDPVWERGCGCQRGTACLAVPV